MEKPLKGIIPPVITPLKDFDELDIGGLENLINHLLTGGVHGLFILGTNGEAPSLSYRLRKELILKTCELADGKVPVLVGITDTSMAGSLEVCDAAADAGADACVMAPPYYYPVDNMELADYIENLVPRLSLPFLLYNMPTHTKVQLSVDTVRIAKELGAIGIKDSSGDMFYTYTLLEAFRDDPSFSILSGTELFLPETVQNGGHGAVAGGANMFPSLFVKYYEAAIADDEGTIANLRDKVMSIYHTIYSVGKYNSRFTKGTKCVLSVKGICDDYMAPPLNKFNPSERKQIERHLKAFNIE